MVVVTTRVEQPVVCRPTDKQRRYCKCIGSTCCGASLAAFLRDTTYERFWLFTRSIVRSGGSILSYRVRLPRRRETIVVTRALYRARFLSLFLDFRVSKDLSCLCLSFTFRPSLCLFLVCPPVRLARRMDSRERIENNKADHVTQVQMRRNYTPDTVVSRTKYLFQYNIYWFAVARTTQCFSITPTRQMLRTIRKSCLPERIKNTIVNDVSEDPFDRDYCTSHCDIKLRTESIRSTDDVSPSSEFQNRVDYITNIL